MLNEMFEAALKEYGVAEVPGKENNPTILAYAKFAGLDWVKDDETSWCGISMAFCAKIARFEVPKNAASARAWLKWGYHVEHPRLGDLVVFWRNDPTSWKGHVGFYINRLGENIYVLGGNQGGKVCIAPYPQARVLGYRSAEKR